MSTPAVSVVIPAFRVAPYIAETLDSVLAQTCQDFEILVVDDGSPDDEALRAAVAPYRDRIRYLEQPQGGPSKARNTAIAAARGEFLAFLDGDDLWAPEFLAAQLATLVREPDVVLVWADSQPFGAGADGASLMAGAPPAGDCDLAALLTAGCVVITSTVVARRQAVIEAGGFDESLHRCEDFDLWLRLALRGRLRYTRQVLGRRRLHPSSQSAAPAAMLRAQIARAAAVRPDDAAQRGRATPRRGGGCPVRSRNRARRRTSAARRGRRHRSPAGVDARGAVAAQLQADGHAAPARGRAVDRGRAAALAASGRILTLLAGGPLRTAFRRHEIDGRGRRGSERRLRSRAAPQRAEASRRPRSRPGAGREQRPQLRDRDDPGQAQAGRIDRAEGRGADRDHPHRRAGHHCVHDGGDGRGGQRCRAIQPTGGRRAARSGRPRASVTSATRRPARSSQSR